MPDRDAESRDYRPDGGPTWASCLRVLKLRLCHERLGKHGGPVDSSMPGGTRLTQFHPREHNFTAVCQYMNGKTASVASVPELVSRLRERDLPS